MLLSATGNRWVLDWGEYRQVVAAVAGLLDARADSKLLVQDELVWVADCQSR
jgi:hypothetical protein